MKWPIFRYLSGTLLPFVVVVFAIGWVVVLVLVLGMAALRGISSSGWDMATAQLARWLMFGIGMHLARKLLQVAVAHGRTRREFMAQAGAFTVVLSAASAALTAVGYVLERLVYRAAGWRHALQQPHFDSAWDVPSIFVTYWAMFAMWTAVGMLVISGFDRLRTGAVLTLALGFVLVLPAVVAVGHAGSLPFFRGFDIARTTSLPVAVALCAASWAIALLVTWGLIRDIPVKARSAA